MRWSGIVSLAVLVLAGCDQGVPSAELARLRGEAQAANQRAVAAHAEQPTRTPGRTLALAGQLAEEVELDWPQLDELARSHVRTVNPHNPTNRAQLIDYRGVRVSDLLDRFHAGDAAAEVTFVSIDGYRSTLPVAELRRFPITLALEADGAPIDRWHGGPLYLVFPHSEVPETERYTGRFWSFYVTHLIVGTEPARLLIGERRLGAVELAALPRAELDSVVGWKVQWPVTSVHLRGVRVADALRAAGVEWAAGDRVTVRGKAAVHRDPRAPLSLAADDLERCGFLLVSHWGGGDEAMPARLGGPLALAVPPACADRYGERFWIPFVEELVLVRGKARPAHPARVPGAGAAP